MGHTRELYFGLDFEACLMDLYYFQAISPKTFLLFVVDFYLYA